MASRSGNRLSNKVVSKTKQKPVPVKIVSEPGLSVKEDNSWRARDDLRTLQQAAEIQADRERLKAAKTEANKMMKGLSKVCGK